MRQVLPELLRDLGAPFPAIWEYLHPAHGPREAARVFAKIIGALETHGATTVVPALTAALATGTPFLLALPPAAPGLTAISPEAVPLALRTIDVASGTADVDGHLEEVNLGEIADGYVNGTKTPRRCPRGERLAVNEPSHGVSRRDHAAGSADPARAGN